MHFLWANCVYSPVFDLYHNHGYIITFSTLWSLVSQILGFLTCYFAKCGLMFYVCFYVFFIKVKKTCFYVFYLQNNVLNIYVLNCSLRA